MRVAERLGVITLLITLIASSSAVAQSTYVSASLVGDVFRSTHSESRGGVDYSNDGEALGFALRVGTPLGSQWGVELEFARPGEIETDFAGPIILASGLEAINSLSGYQVSQIFPAPFSYRLRTTQRHTTLATTAWFFQDVSQRVSLIYLAGMGFSRTTVESETRFDILPATVAPLILPVATTITTYGVRPLVGLEARIGLTEQIDLVPGFRLHGLQEGWLLRPAVGLAWNF